MYTSASTLFNVDRPCGKKNILKLNISKAKANTILNSNLPTPSRRDGKLRGSFMRTIFTGPSSTNHREAPLHPQDAIGAQACPHLLHPERSLGLNAQRFDQNMFSSTWVLFQLSPTGALPQRGMRGVELMPKTNRLTHASQQHGI